MSPHDADLYAKLKSSVQNQIHSIRVILEGLQVGLGMDDCRRT